MMRCPSRTGAAVAKGESCPTGQVCPNRHGAGGFLPANCSRPCGASRLARVVHPWARRRTLMRIVIDAGHGRGRSNGKSTALGAHGPSGVCEADVTIRLARLLARRLGSGVALTRTDDDNPTLAERAERARQFDADVLVSLHANQGAPPARGAEVWIHDRASEASRVLA